MCPLYPLSIIYSNHRCQTLWGLANTHPRILLSHIIGANHNPHHLAVILINLILCYSLLFAVVSHITKGPTNPKHNQITTIKLHFV